MKTKTPTLSAQFRAALLGQAVQRLGLILAVLALPGLVAAANLTGRYTTITLDGTLADWQPSDTLYSVSEIAAGGPPAATITNVSVCNDTDNLYVALQVPEATSISSPWTYNLYIESDMKPATGFTAGWMSSGYDHLVQYGAAGSSYSIFQFAGGSQADWSWNWITLINYSFSDTVIEWAIPLSALNLTTNKLKLEFNVTGTGTTAETWAYKWESGASTYTLATPPDNNPPLIEAVEGAPNKVRLAFSKNLEAASATTAANYSLSEGVSVLSAVLTDARTVTLATGAQTRGTTYTLTLNNVKADNGVAIAANTQKPFVSSILIDGSDEDWADIPAVYNNEQGDPSVTDYKDIYVYDDTNYLYMRVTLWEPSDLVSSQNNFFFNTDGDPLSGYRPVGSELLVENGKGYQQKNGGFNEGLINGLDWLCAGAGQTNYEFRISKAATYATDGKPVFTADSIRFAFDAEAAWVPVNRMPAAGTVPYTLLVVPPLPLGPLTIAAAGTEVTVSWPGAGTLQACGTLTGNTWTNVPDATSPYTTSVNAAPALYFRLAR